MSILQLFIDTVSNSNNVNNDSLTHLNNVPEPLPEGSETSLFFRNGLFFSEVLPQSFGKSKGWSLEDKAYLDNKNKRYGEFTNAPVSANDIDLSKLTQFSFYKNGNWEKTEYYFPDNKVTWNLSSMTLKPTSSRQLQLLGEKTQSINFKRCYTRGGLFIPPVSCHPEDIKNDAKSEVNAFIDSDINGTGRNQCFITKIQDSTMKVGGHLSGGGASGSDDLEAQVNQKINEYVPPQIKARLNDITFTPISLFAIKNLLFPKDNYINFEKVAVPGDMIILGNFNKDTSFAQAYKIPEMA